MKSTIALFSLLVFTPLLIHAATLFGQAGGGHTAQLTWSESADGGTVNIYRAAAACSTNPASFTQIKTGVAAAGPYTDSTIAVGSWCYYVTAVVGGAESGASNKITLTVLPQPPTGLAGTAN